jgi:hypothetical protein
MAEFDHIARGAAKAINREQLDQPAKDFGAWMGQLSKDGVLAMVGAAGGAIAPKVMPRVEQVITTEAAGVKEALIESKTSRLGEPELVTPEGVRVKIPQKSVPGQSAEDLRFYAKTRGADIGGSRAPLEGRGIPNRGNEAPEWYNSNVPAAGDAKPTGALKGHAGKHGGDGILPPKAQAFYDQAVKNMNFGAKFEYTHKGQIKTAYITKVGEDEYLFTGCSRNSKRIFTHYAMKEEQFRKIGITLKQE